MRTSLFLDVFDFHALYVHDFAAAFTFRKNAFSWFSSYLEVFFLAAGAGKFPVMLVFFDYHCFHLLYIIIHFCLLNDYFPRLLIFFQVDYSDEAKVCSYFCHAYGNHFYCRVCPAKCYAKRYTKHYVRF